MSALPDVRPTAPTVRHVAAEEYRAFVMQRGDIRSGSNLLRAYRRFVRHYPDLVSWFGAPLAERVGQTWPRSGQAYVSAVARPYLYYLASRGVAFDWEWVIAAERHILTPKLLPPAVAEFIRESITAAVGLGYGRKGVASNALPHAQGPLPAPPGGNLQRRHRCRHHRVGAFPRRLRLSP